MTVTPSNTALLDDKYLVGYKPTHRRSEPLTQSKKYEVIVITEKLYKKEVQRVFDTYNIDQKPATCFRACVIL